jgi:hypothetical protein
MLLLARVSIVVSTRSTSSGYYYHYYHHINIVSSEIEGFIISCPSSTDRYIQPILYAEALDENSLIRRVIFIRIATARANLVYLHSSAIAPTNS